MTYYQICFYDSNEPEFHGEYSDYYTTREAAEAGIKWYKEHPDETQISCTFYIKEVNLNKVVDTFTPPMTDEEYNERMSLFWKALAQECGNPYPGDYEYDVVLDPDEVNY